MVFNNKRHTVAEIRGGPTCKSAWAHAPTQLFKILFIIYIFFILTLLNFIFSRVQVSISICTQLYTFSHTCTCFFTLQDMTSAPKPPMLLGVESKLRQFFTFFQCWYLLKHSMKKYRKKCHTKPYTLSIESWSLELL